MPPFELTAFSLISISHSSLSSLLPFANTILVGFYRYSKISRYFCFTLLTRFYKMDCLLLEFFGITWLVFCHDPLLQRVYQISLLQLYQTGGISEAVPGLIAEPTGTDGFPVLCHQFALSSLPRQGSCLKGSSTCWLRRNQLREALLLL